MPGKKKFYHVTSVDCVESILRVGLKGGTKPRNRSATMDRPSIFVLVSDEGGLTDNIAVNQIWLFQDIGDYAVIEIDPTGVTGSVMEDNVAEFSAPWHRIIEQKVIEPTYLKLAEIRTLNYPGKKVLEAQQSCGQRKWTTEEWMIARKWLAPPFLHFQQEFETGTTSPQAECGKTKVKKQKTKRK